MHELSSLIILIIQIVSIVLYSQYTTYEDTIGYMSSGNEISNQNYLFFQNIHVMVFVGFGFLMTFLKKYGFSSISYNFLISALCIQLSILINAFFHQALEGKWHKIELNIESLVTGDFSAVAVMITFGALLGKVTHIQMITVAIIELIFYAINKSIGIIEYKAVDMGGSMFVHTFGAIFGLVTAFVLNQMSNNKKKSRELNKSRYDSDMFAMMGTLFLWIYWPSFNGVLASENSQHRVIINTVLSLCASCMSAFMISFIIRKGKFNMIDIQNATLAGGIAIGSSAAMTIAPYASLIIGMVAGGLSVLGYAFVGPWLEAWEFSDTCGVNNLHGMPGIMGSLASIISVAVIDQKLFGKHINDIYPAMAEGRTPSQQALFQLATLGTTIGIAVIGGILTGIIISLPFYTHPEKYYNDVEFWELPEKDKKKDHKKKSSIPHER